MPRRRFFRLGFVRPLFLGACAVVCVLATTATSWAVEPPSDAPVQLVGLVSAPPFAIKDDEGNWTGIAVELWRRVASDLGLHFEFREMAIPDLMAGLQRSDLLAVATVTASPEREMMVDLSHPYYTSGLVIAVPVRATSSDWFEPLRDVVSGGTIRITSVLLALLLVAAVLVWLSERRANPDHFSPQPVRGIADGLWWAAVTLTTVGYGDKAPRTRAGRLIGIIWMFAAIILIALFTAQVTSSLTVTSLTGRVRGPADLAHVAVGAIKDSPAQAILGTKFGVAAAGYPGFHEALAALDRGDIDAFVGPAPVLRYEVERAFSGRLAIVGEPFTRVDYVFAFPLGSPLRKQANRSILSYIETDDWRNLLRAYLGTDS